ncbi:MAG: ornithine cyclodeaminase family protein [Pseudomonadota bacterium]
MADETPIVLGDAALEGLGISPLEILDCVEEALSGGVLTAPKASVVPGDGRYMMATLSTGGAADTTVVKTVTVAPGNAARGLAGIEGVIILLDGQTGLLRAVMGSGWITGVRTAGLSAVAARRMADPASRVIAFVGTGLQARTHLDAFAALFPLTEVRAFGRGGSSVGRLCDKAEAMGLKAIAAPDAESALDGADLVVTSVTLDFELQPFLDARWLKPGAFAAVTDLGLPWKAEGNSAFGRIVIDDTVQEAASGHKLCDPALVSGDLGDLVSGRLKAGPDPSRPQALFFRGVAVGDHAVAALAWERARTAGVGAPLPGWSLN